MSIDPECAICMLVMVKPTRLPCKHVFCQTCAKASVSFKRECPMCRSVPPKTFKFPISADLTAQFKQIVDPELWQARENQVGQAISPRAALQEEEKEP
mmetsp:Transcript_656/g.886  ORF Transcript_656/g.886 Transcript_656/m.886 type:complete len:98 (-) Transcript_656:516-809(-)